MRLDGLDGKTKWSWTSPDQRCVILDRFEAQSHFFSSLTVISHVLATPTTIYLVGLAKSLASYTLHVTALSTSTGVEISSAHVPSSIIKMSDLISVRDLRQSSITPVVVWLQNGQIMSYPLTPELGGKHKSTTAVKYRELVDVGLRNHGYLVAIERNGSSSVLQLTMDASTFKTIRIFADSVCISKCDTMVSQILISRSQGGFRFRSKRPLCRRFQP